MSAYHLVFIQSEVSSDEGHNAICVLNIPLNNHSWKVVHKVVTIINALIPFLVNLCCTITIIYIVTKKKMNANVRHTGKCKQNIFNVIFQISISFR
jgi:mannose/fructose/N-acetylgalactosamine-specific phosphotransferase system component IID